MRNLISNKRLSLVLDQLHKKAETKEGLVFPSKNNQPFNHVKRSWGSLLKKANITQFRQ
jgi:hypothetical protein